ncbi:MAG: FHA domain-containing protein [Fimbriiglobus sp.]|jgi:pSer/pThr/pTyr-binding forkhead associated (FHA) protein|nr:FHA domain-containing protein [Fimbriiglobus sp.]
MRARLIPADGGDPVDLTRDVVLVGRGEDCDLRVDHKSVSKRHCVLVCTDGLVLLRDLGSTNGTRVNGTRVRRAALLPNDQIAFANFRFKLEFGPGSPAPQADQPGETIPPRPDDRDDFEVDPDPPPGLRADEDDDDE